MEDTGTAAAEDKHFLERSGVRFGALKYPALLLVIIVGFHWKLVLTRQYDWLWGPDLTQQVLPWLEQQSLQVHQHRFPLWDPHTWAGQPLAGQAQPGTAYPLNWLLFAMPRSQHISRDVLQWYFVLIHFMAALFCYLLCRDLGRSHAASVIGGCIFALSGYFASVGWPQMVNGALWAPLVFMFLLRTVRGVRAYSSAAWCGAALGMSWLSGHHQAPIFMTFACGGVWLFYFLRSGRPDWRIARAALLAVAISGLVGAMQILPASEYGRLAQRWAGADHALRWDERVPYSVHGQLSTPPTELPGVVLPMTAGGAHPFVGLTAFVFAVLSAALCWREHGVRLFTAIGIGAVLFALGMYDVLHGVIYSVVPLAEKARAPGMAIFIFACSVAALAAYAIDYGAASEPGDAFRRAARTCAIFGAGFFALVMAVQFALRTPWPLDRDIVMPAVTALLLAALLYGRRAGAVTSRQFVFLLAGLVLIDMGTEYSYILARRDDPGRQASMNKMTRNADIAAFLSAQQQPFRIDTQGDDLGTNWGEYHNLSFLTAFTPSVTLNIASFEWHTRQTKRLFNVRYTVARTAPSPEMKEVFQGEGGLNVYEDPLAFPRAWTVHEVARISNDDQGRYYVSNELDGLRRKAFMSAAPPPVDACVGDEQPQFQTYAASRVIVRANMACRGMLVLSDTYYPGWRAYVDGKRVPIYEVNFGMRGVVVPAGSHEVRFSYRPASVYAGAALTLLGLLLAGGIAFVSRRRSGRHEREKYLQ